MVFFYLIHSLPFDALGDYNGSRNVRTLFFGAICYVFAHTFLWSSVGAQFSFFRSYLYWILAIDMFTMAIIYKNYYGESILRELGWSAPQQDDNNTDLNKINTGIDDNKTCDSGDNVTANHCHGGICRLPKANSNQTVQSSAPQTPPDNFIGQPHGDVAHQTSDSPHQTNDRLKQGGDGSLPAGYWAPNNNGMMIFVVDDKQPQVGSDHLEADNLDAYEKSTLPVQDNTVDTVTDTTNTAVDAGNGTNNILTIDVDAETSIGPINNSSSLNNFQTDQQIIEDNSGDISVDAEMGNDNGNANDAVQIAEDNNTVLDYTDNSGNTPENDLELALVSE